MAQTVGMLNIIIFQLIQGLDMHPYIQAQRQIIMESLLMHGTIGTEKALVNCVGDNGVKSIGSNSIYGNCSPHRLKTYTITDQLKMTYPQSKVISISIKDRGAILPGGHKSDGSYWFDYQSGKFITSSYFKKALPSWMVDFNDNKNCYTYADTWVPLLSNDKYISKDQSNYEVIIPGKIKGRIPL